MAPMGLKLADNLFFNRPLRRNQAAQYIQDKWNLACSAKTLAKLACVGGGPLHRLGGRFPLYETNDLDEWCRSRISGKRRSTSEVVA